MRSFLIPMSLMVVLGFSGLQAQEQSDTQKDNQRLLVEVLEGYQKLLSDRLEIEEEDINFNAWRLVSMALRDGLLRLTVAPYGNSMLNATRFIVTPQSEVAYIAISEDLLEYWSVYPSTVMTILSAGVQEAAQFFTNPEVWADIQTDLMGQVFLKLKLWEAQARLIKDRLLPGGYLLSAYDTYVLDSYDQDNLSSVILFLEELSLPVIQTMYSIRLSYEKDEDNTKMRTALIELGKELLEKRQNMPQKSPEHKIYAFAIAIKSWLIFSPEMISRIHNRTRSDNPLPFQQVLAREPKYKDIRLKLEENFTKDQPLAEKIRKQTQKKFATQTR